LDNVKEVKQNEKWFETNHLKGNLKSQTVKSGINTIAGQAVSFVLSISSTAIMARLLTPEDYGLVTMVSAVTGFVTTFKDLGLSSAIIQKEKIDQRQVSSVFWINVAISSGIALIVALLAPFLVYLYGESRLLNITLVFSLSIFLTGFSLQHNALLKRQMKFKVLSLIQIGSTAISLLAGICLAYANFGYWAIVLSGILNPILSTIVLWIVCDWRPNFIFKATEINSFLKFGAGMAGFDLINYFSRNADNVLIGKYVGSGALGIYMKSYQLLMLPITQLRDPLNAVALPALSTLQSESIKFTNFYKKYAFTLSFFSMPLVLFMGIFSEELVFIVLGNQWTKAALIFKLLAISSFIQPVASTKTMILISTGKTKMYFIWGLINAVFVVLGFIIGVRWGVEGVAISYAVVNYLLLIPSLYLCFHNSPVKVSDFFNEIKFPVIFSLISGGVVILFKLRFIHLPYFILSPLGLIIGALVYIAPWFLTRESRSKLQQLTELKNMVKSKTLKK